VRSAFMLSGGVLIALAGTAALALGRVALGRQRPAPAAAK
jgi:hypothetical protein